MGLGLGPFEMILIFAVLLLLFGAKRLPELASGMGKGIRDFKRSLNGLDDQSVQANQQQNYLQATPAAPAQVAAAPAAPVVETPAAAGEPRRLG
ncbi:twin-arginine translocase TatA/TatE family subunit [Longimicrobium sp.]|uniref:Sec-independent protein translocase subunit TatA/TatB n=1 Tax=Longimicrobium sp. TaxID=2029185 RepID=UPI002C827107|nr:twin-arginine translocase TatA/TatE family subunit [Longimicrobium sp.]HSU14215.1 twin-arginine translocase TatA/TatE family subunit [Longimicrobium sp.]